MPLESATFISDLVATNPAHTDGLNAADSHLRLLKAVLQAQFTNLGTTAVTATAAQLNSVSVAFGTTGVLEVPANGVAGGKIKLDHGTGSGDVLIKNTGAAGQTGILSVVINNASNVSPQTAATLDWAGNLAATTSLNAPSVLKGGNELIPVGIICLWSGSTGSIPAGWALCDGGTYNGHVTPNLRDRFVVGAGSTYAVAQTGGATSVTTSSDTQGTHSHTGATGAGGSHTPSGFTDSQGSHNHANAQPHTLTTSEIPGHTHNVTIGAGPSSGGVTGFIGGVSGVIGSGTFTTDSGGLLNGQSHSHNILADGAHSHNLSMSTVPDHTHSISSDGSHLHNVSVATLPPFYALCYIMKIS
jgi:hypothetical protein